MEKPHRWETDKWGDERLKCKGKMRADKSIRDK